MKVLETGIPMVFKTQCKEKNMDIESTDLVENIYHGIFRAVMEFLAIKKNKNYPVALEIRNLKEQPVFIAKVTCHKGEEDEAPNWSIESSFDIKDMEIDENTKTYLVEDDSFFQVLNSCFIKMHEMKIIEKIFGINLVVEAFNVLKKWLDENASANKIVTIEEEGYFTAAVAVENNEKVFSIVPDGACKTLIKDDSQLVSI